MDNSSLKQLADVGGTAARRGFPFVLKDQEVKLGYCPLVALRVVGGRCDRLVANRLGADK